MECSPSGWVGAGAVARGWWLSWSVGVLLGTVGFLVRVLLSLLVGENLWVVITRAGAGMLDRVITLLHLPISADLTSVQLMALLGGGSGGDLRAVPARVGVLDFPPFALVNSRATTVAAWIGRPRSPLSPVACPRAVSSSGTAVDRSG